jgi:ATP-dependent DNA helicase RecG
VAAEHATPQATPQATPHVEQLLAVIDGELTRDELQERLAITDRKHFRDAYLQPALEAGLIEMTIPDKPKSPRQKYRLTDAGQQRSAFLPQ